MTRVARIVGTLVLVLVAPWARAQPAPPFADGFESAKPKEPIGQWMVPTPGFAADVMIGDVPEGKQAVKLAPSGSGTAAPFGNFMQSLPARGYAGRRVELAAKMKVEGDDRARGQMWLRVDRKNGEVGAFDNMHDRPVRPGDWNTVKIVADIENDAAWINIGFMSMAGATVQIDDVSLTVTLTVTGDASPRQQPSETRALSARGVLNQEAAARALAYVRFFVASDQAAGVMSWDHVAVDLMEKAEPANDAAKLATILGDVLGPLAPTMQFWAGEPGAGPAAVSIPAGTPIKGTASWRHLGVGAVSDAGPMNIYRSEIVRVPIVGDERPPEAACFRVKQLPGGVCCRIPVKVFYTDEGTLPRGATPPAYATAAQLTELTAMNRTTRLAGVASAWGIFQHFYPYFDVVTTDWNAALTDGLKKAAQDADEVQYLYTLRELVAQLHDGHGNVFKQGLRVPTIFPLSLEWAGTDLVVVGKVDGEESAADVKVGDVVVSIDGRSAADCYKDVSRWVSAATDGWRRHMSTQRLVINLPMQDPAAVALRRPDGTAYTANIRRGQALAANTATSKRPTAGEEVAPGIVYFDLNGADTEALSAIIGTLNGATGIIFDMRGYPNQAAWEVIQHLIDEHVTSARWNVPIVTLPDREGWEWHESGRWDMAPLAPRWKMPVTFLTDGRAISYAESIMGIIEHYKLGEIVGAATAGTNGNVNPFALPGDFRISWTGMKVLKHDGSQHHGVGILPTVPVTPTAKGIAEGRDEVLERAIDVTRSKIGTPAK